ncbi:MAG: D-alanyl-D-alanine carboxypeptidase/D-alanyl-D-alanine-endopeptidase [Verrucomicrobia bacterium]|nr:D-alanyl-D-alanine carboxypeptidase/D-alanyl-D-alanine-endopeptidase [Verrucomicrobiota bacterium]
MASCCRNIFILLSLILFSAGAEAGSKSHFDRKQALSIQRGMEQIVAAVDPNVHIGIEVVSLTTGKTIYAHNAGHLFMPASTMKLITGAAALEILGSNYRFLTKIYADGPIEKGTLKGNLWIKGSGDPELSTASLEDLVFQLKLKGIQRIHGNIYIDRSDFDGVAQGPGWTWDDGAVDWNSPLDALTINHSCVNVCIKPNACCDLPAEVHVQPKTSYVTVENHALTTDISENLQVERRWRTKENIIDVSGSIVKEQEVQKFMIPVELPHLYAASVFRDLLDQNGIKFKGAIEEKTIGSNLAELASHASRPLFEMVVEMMKESDNLIADTLFKKMGQRTFEAPGSWENGSEAVNSFLKDKVGIDPSNTVIVDGSGLSRYNLLSPHQIIALLMWVDRQGTSAAEFMVSLPISGVDGTLKNRMTDPAIKGKVRAKTGSLMGVSTIAGYATTEKGETIAFSIMMSGFTGKSREYKLKIEDQILDLLIKKIQY